MHVPKALKQMNLPSMRMDLDGWDGFGCCGLRGLFPNRNFALDLTVF